MTSDLPKEWKLESFEKLFAIPLRNGIYKKKEFHGRGVKIINMGELFAYPRLKDVTTKRVVLSDKECSNSLLQNGDLIFARRSLTAEGAGKCSIVLEVSEPTTFESSIIRVRLDREIANPEFYYYLFNSKIGKWLLGTILRQVAVAGITGSDLGKLIVPVPPLSIQNNIANQCALLDEKIEINCRINQTLEEMAQAVFKSWFVDFEPVKAKMAALEAGGKEEDAVRAAMRTISGKTNEALDRLQHQDPQKYTELRSTAKLFPSAMQDSEQGEIPDGWNLSNLARFAYLNRNSWSKSNSPDFIEYVDLANTKLGVIEHSKQYYWASAPSRARRILKDGDTIIGTVRPGNKSFAFVKNPAKGYTGSTGFAVLSPVKKIYSELIYLTATRDESIDHLARLADGGAYPAVNPEEVSKLTFVFPGDPLVSCFHKRVIQMFELRNAYFNENQMLTKLRDTLFPKLLSGQISLNEMRMD